MLAILERLDDDSRDLGLMVELLAALRPRHADDATSATAQVRTLCQLLKGKPAHAAALRQYLRTLLLSRRHASLYTETGVLSNDGFFSELKRRVAYRILPPALGDDYLSDALDRILLRRSDQRWIRAVPADDWLALFDVLCAVPDDRQPPLMLAGLLEAIRTLSYRISAIGLEPRLTNFHTAIETHESPFLAQNLETLRFLAHCAERHGQQQDPGLAASHERSVPCLADEDGSHLLVMLDQCDKVIASIRKQALRQGTSIALTYLLVTLSQSIQRLRRLLELLAPMPDAQRRLAALSLAQELIAAHSNKYLVRDLVRDNINLLARNITENASQTGEHYVADDRRQLRQMFYSSAGAGLVIGFMALFKLLLSNLHSAPLVATFLYSMNYALGFMFIHLLHFTVATKQPAMTASHIAAGLHSKDGRNIDIDSMAELCNKVVRTQNMAVLGNLATAIPVAWLIAMCWPYLTGQPLVAPAKALQMLHDIDPLGGPTLLYAAIAGVCLFLSGLISGYYDNQALYTRWAQRIRQLRLLERLIGPARLERLGNYLEANLGGLMGNFYFGILLGVMPLLGFLLGLPLDIRHVTFSSANFATAMVALDYQASWQLILTSVLGFLAIGSINLLVSFSLALWVALRARQVRFRQGWQLLAALLRRWQQAPIRFFIGTRDSNTVPPGD